MSEQLLSCPDTSIYAQLEALSLPVIPVTLWFDEGRSRWCKQPRVEWDRATTDLDVVEGWWLTWPEALPGIPLRLTDLCVVDADTPEAVEEMRSLRMLGPHSKVGTANGGLHMVFAQPPEPISRFRWSEGVEVLGTSSLLTCYDLEALRFPRVAPRAVLPEMFWKPKAGGGWRVEDGFIRRENVGLSENSAFEAKSRNPRIKRREERSTAEVADLTAGLWEMDAEDWRGDYDGWFHLAGAAQALGIAENEFVRWSLTDPVYAADERAIRRIWNSAQARHGGALHKALAERGIRVGAQRSLYPGVPFQHGRTIDVRLRTTGLIAYFDRQPTTDRLFAVACVFAEIVAEGRLKIGVAQELLWNNLGQFRKSIGDDEFRRTISNAFRHVEEKLLSE
jgi:hypothetical protein